MTFDESKGAFGTADTFSNEIPVWSCCVLFNDNPALSNVIPRLHAYMHDKFLQFIA